jgi:hypothetical protein
MHILKHQGLEKEVKDARKKWFRWSLQAVPFAFPIRSSSLWHVHVHVLCQIIVCKNGLSLFVVQTKRCQDDDRYCEWDSEQTSSRLQRGPLGDQKDGGMCTCGSCVRAQGPRSKLSLMGEIYRI